MIKASMAAPDAAFTKHMALALPLRQGTTDWTTLSPACEALPRF
jgi:hypothetical protein